MEQEFQTDRDCIIKVQSQNRVEKLSQPLNEIKRIPEKILLFEIYYYALKIIAICLKLSILTRILAIRKYENERSKSLG